MQYHKFINDNSKYGDVIYCDPPYIARTSNYWNTWTEKDEYLSGKNGKMQKRKIDMPLGKRFGAEKIP